MENIKFKYFNIEVSRYIYGCMKIGGKWSNEPIDSETISNALNCINTALESGINYFDLADIYCRGKSEEAFSYIWGEHPNLREKIIIQSKCGIRFEGEPDNESPHRFDFSYSHIIKSVDSILKRLKTDYLDVLLLHRPDPLVEPAEVAKAFFELYNNGKVRNFGVSNHNGFQIELLKKYIEHPLIINQVEFNLKHNHLVNEGVVINNNQRTSYKGDSILDYCRLNDIIIQAWAPVIRGYYTNSVTEESQNDVKQVFNLLKVLAVKYNISEESVLIAWIKTHPAKIQPVIGSGRPDRIKRSCEGDELILTREEWYKLFLAARGEDIP